MRTTDGARIVKFAESCCRITRGSRTGELITLRAWQRELLVDLAAAQPRRAYVQMPRKNGKSLLGAILALYNLLADGEAGAEIYSVAGSRDQARLVFDEAANMVRLDPWLSKHLTVWRHEIHYQPANSTTKSKYRVMAADAGHAEGVNPHLVIFDEVHVAGSDRRLWDTMNLGSGTREAPLVLGITTPGVRWGTDGRDSLAWSMYDYAGRVRSGEIDDPHFFARVWEAPANCELRDPAAWAEANPGLGDFMADDDMDAACKTTPENEFRTKRLGQWVSTTTAWLPYGAWGDCLDELAPAEPPARARVVLGFDGSRFRDSTALIGATVEDQPFVWVVGLWERDPRSPLAWRVPEQEVDAAIGRACERWDVAEIACDPYLWRREIEDWEARGLPVVEYPQTPARMVPATQRFYEAVTTQVMRHSGNPALARHLGNAQLKPNGQVAKEHKDSGRKIDAAVAAILAYDRAAFYARTPTRAAVFVL